MSLWDKFKGFAKQTVINCFDITEWRSKDKQGYLYLEIYDASSNQIRRKFTYMPGDHKRTNPICLENYDDYGRLHSKFSLKDHKKNGLCQLFHPDGQLREKRIYKDDHLEGPFESYFRNGQLDTKGTYKDDKLNGLCEDYYQSGQLRTRCTYKDGDLNGLCEDYHKNGQLAIRCTYKNGRSDGLVESYNEDGSLAEKHLWCNGVRQDDSKISHYLQEELKQKREAILTGVKQQLAEATDMEKIKKSLRPARTPERTERAAEITNVRRAKEILSRAAQSAHRAGDAELVNEVGEIALPYALRDRRIRRELQKKRADRRAK